MSLITTENRLKIAFTTSGENLDAPLESRFGRAPKFLIFDSESNNFKLLDNAQNLIAAQGAGVQAAANLARAQVDIIVTGHCGPKAFQVLKAAGIKIYTTDVPTVTAAMEAYRSGGLRLMESADVEGHWS